MISPSTLLVPVGAGLTSALLFAGLVMQAGSAVALAFAAPVPIAIAGLGWGSLAGVLSVAAAAATLVALTPNTLGVLTYVLAFGLPTALGAYLIGLARPVEAPNLPGRAGTTHTLDWYPLGRVLFAITGTIALGCAILGWAMGYDPAELVPQLVEGLQESGGTGLEPADIQAFAETIVGLIPLVQPAILTAVIVACLYLGAAATRISGRLPRPKDDIPNATALPRAAAWVALAGTILAFLGGTVGIIGALVCGAFTTAFALAGLASLHRRTRGRPARGLILFTSYAAILLLTFPILIFAGLGLIESWRGHGSPRSSV